ISTRCRAIWARRRRRISSSVLPLYMLPTMTSIDPTPGVVGVGSLMGGATLRGPQAGCQRRSTRRERLLSRSGLGDYPDVMDADRDVKRSIYAPFAATGERPAPGGIAARLGLEPAAVREAMARLRAQRVLVLDGDGESIRMAPPFSGVPTQHRVTAGGV